MGSHEEALPNSGDHNETTGSQSVEVDAGADIRSSRRILVERTLFLYMAGQVKRWHTSPVLRQDTVGGHTWGVVALILRYHPNPSLRLIRCAMFHDVAELRTGDMPRWAKERPGVRASLENAEREVHAEQALPTEDSLNESEKRWLRCADLMDAWLFMRQEMIMGNQCMKADYAKATTMLTEWHGQAMYLANSEPIPLLKVFIAIKEKLS